MTQHLFITSSGKLRPIWAEVFPYARGQSSFSNIQGVEKPDVVWIEWPSKLDERHYSEIEALVSTGRPVVVLSTAPNDAQAQTAISLGAKGYCHSYAVSSQLKDVATVVSSGGLWLGADLLQKVLSGVQSASTSPAKKIPDKRINELTKRELAVAEVVAKGLTNKEISIHLGIGERTVKSHLSVIFQKLQIRDRVQLALLLNGIDPSAS